MIAFAMSLLVFGSQEAVLPTIEQQLVAGAAWAAKGIPDGCLVEIAEASGSSLDQPGILEAARQRAQRLAGLHLIADDLSQQSIVTFGSSRAHLEAAKFLGEISADGYAERLQAINIGLGLSYQQLWERRLAKTACEFFGPNGQDGLRVMF